MKYLILGAGPAGLTLANRLLELGESSVCVLEKESEAGGLCRTKYIQGKPFDIGGGHFLDNKNKEVVRYLYRFLPENEWNLFHRNSQISIHNTYINNPIESNIWQLDIDKQVEYLVSISEAACNKGEKRPERFTEWIEWKLGKCIADNYMLPYNKKMFAEQLDELGTYWLEKLPNVSFEQTLRSCLEHKAYGEQPAHESFLYPKKYGYGEVWKRMAKKIEKHIVYNQKVSILDVRNKSVITESGEKYFADYIINTVPWNEFEAIYGIDYELVEQIKLLKHTSVETRLFDENYDSNAHWIYFPQEEIPYHRILNRSQFALESNGYWTETREERMHLFGEDKDYVDKYTNQYAYPLNTIDKPSIIKSLLDVLRERDVYGLGRWGEHEHLNSDVVVNKALKLAESLSNAGREFG